MKQKQRVQYSQTAATSCYMESLGVAYSGSLKRSKHKRPDPTPFRPLVIVRRNGVDIGWRRIGQ